jgi:hypothetical protein
MVASPSPLIRPAHKHLHVAGEVCPWCEQPIPHDKFEEISSRIKARERDHFAKEEARLKQQFAREKAEAEGKAATREAAAREETRKTANLAAQEKLAAADSARRASEAALQAKIMEAEQARATVERAQAELKSQLQAANGAIEALKQQIVTNEAAAREEGKKAAEASMHERLAEAERKKAEAITRWAAAEEAKLTAERQVRAVAEAQQITIGEVREACDKDKTMAVLAEQKKAFDERQKLQATVQDLQRQLEKKRADELGEGAEIDLFEELKGAFEDDRIARVKKGTPGADIIHEVMHNGNVCGRIIYDSKNRNKWDGRYVSKLREDQLAAKAEHAILSSLKFPGKTSQLHFQDGVIIACPARVVALAELLRRHIVQMHTLRVSNEERTKKTAALYAFITSDRCRQLLESIETQLNKLSDIDVSEKNTHALVWEKRGRLHEALLKVKGDLCWEIERIIGTAVKTE